MSQIVSELESDAMMVEQLTAQVMKATFAKVFGDTVPVGEEIAYCSQDTRPQPQYDRELLP